MNALRLALLTAAAWQAMAFAPLSMPPSSLLARRTLSVVNGDDDAVVGEDESSPFDLDEPELSSVEPSVADTSAASVNGDARSVTENLLFLQSIGAITGRGEFAKPSQKSAASKVVALVEAANPTTVPCTSPDLLGTWELVYTDAFLFQSSPFFQAGRAVCTTPEQAQQYQWFCEMHRKALAISTIRSVRQIISDSKLVSEFEVSAGAVPFLNDFTPFSYSGGLPVSIDGAIVSTADWSPSAGSGESIEFLMDTVEIKGSNLPVLRSMLDQGLKLQSRQLGSFLENNVSGYTNPRPVWRTTYLDDKFRVGRDVDDHIFVYVKTSESTQPTDYKNVDADLGVLNLLKGFNDAITRAYL